MALSLRNLPILAKIAVPAGIVAVVAVAIAWYGVSAVNQLADTAAALVDRNAARVSLALRAESAFASAAVSEKNVILTGADEKVARGHIDLYRANTTATFTAIDQLQAITEAAQERALIAASQLGGQADLLRTDVNDFLGKIQAA
jgi:methyl-accepting chemotaxis protein